MATITTVANPLSANLPMRLLDNSAVGYTIWEELNIAEAVTAKGTALAAADVIEVLRLPANTQVMAVSVRKTAAMTGSSTDLTFDVGFATDADQFVDGWDFDAAAVGSYGTPLGVGGNVIVGTSDTIDITIATLTGTLTGGKVIVSAFVRDLAVKQRGAIVQPGS